MKKQLNYLLISLLLLFFINPVFASRQPQEMQSFSDFAKVLRVTPVYKETRRGHEECKKKHESRYQMKQQHRSTAVQEPHKNRYDFQNVDCERSIKSRKSRHSHIIGYEVKYKYRGNIYRTHMDQHPGKRLRVKVTIAPDE